MLCTANSPRLRRAFAQTTAVQYETLIDAEKKSRVTEYLGLALGLLNSVDFSGECSEYDIRNGFSRLYYALFHASLGLLLSLDEDIDTYRRSHGAVHAAIARRMGKTVGKFVTEIYEARLHADYEPELMRKRFNGDVAAARIYAAALNARAKRHFYWIYQEARKAL